ncbi:MAG: hypothetical protein LBP80_07995 [Treponema sp.]|nr:hypothetical protein [Treponema sp.]
MDEADLRAAVQPGDGEDGTHLGEPPEGGTGGRAVAPANGVRPLRGKNKAAPCFPPISPRPTAA